MKKTGLFFVVILINSGCVNFQINPGNVIGDTVDAGKALYQTIKRSRNGEEERKYTNYASSLSKPEDTKNYLQCKKNIFDNILASKMTVSKIISEKSEVLETNGDRRLKCELIVLVTSE